MRGMMVTILLIVALIIGILVIKDMNSEDQSHTRNIERIDRTKQTADQATKSINRTKESAKQAGQPESGE